MFGFILLHISVQEMCKSIIEYVGPTCGSHRFNDAFAKKMCKRCMCESFRAWTGTEEKNQFF
jgi:hypothetical protein